MKINYLVLGANGFVGSHLVDALSGLPNAEVRAFDRYSKATSFNLKPNIKLYKGDFFDDKDIAIALSGAEVVFHIFSTTTPQASYSKPIEDTILLKRTVEIFDKCAQQGVGKVIYMSSAATYGESPNGDSLREVDLPHPVSPYGICKLTVENYLNYFCRKGAFEGISYRLTNPYGPRQVYKKNQGVIPLFAHKIMNGEELTVYGDGTTSRDFIFINDAINMIVTSFPNKNKHAVYNLGSGQEHSINDIVALLSKVIGQEARVKFENTSQSGAQRSTVSMERFSSEFGMPQLTPIEEGLGDYIAWLRNAE